jgi:hypothetical protein
MVTGRQLVGLPLPGDGLRRALDEREVRVPRVPGQPWRRQRLALSAVGNMSGYPIVRNVQPIRVAKGAANRGLLASQGRLPPSATREDAPHAPGAMVLKIGVASWATARRARTAHQDKLTLADPPDFDRAGPRTSNEPVSPQPGDVGFQRSNQSSACQSREQRHTGPRTPLHVNEGRPRARHDKKE